MLQMQEAKAAYCRAVTSPRFYKRWVVDSVNNAIGAFGAEGQLDSRTEMIVNLILIVVVLGGYLIYLYKIAPKEE